MKSRSVIAVMISHGTVCEIRVSSLIPVTLVTAYRQTPTGGVTNPKANVITKNTMKNTGSIWTAVTVGSRIGTKI